MSRIFIFHIFSSVVTLLKYNFLSLFQILLDVNREADDLRELERGRAKQLPVREWRAGALPRAVEQGRQGPQVE